MSMFRRLPAALAAVALTVGGMQGCGGGGIDEGIPADVDMSKHYAPAAETKPFNARDMMKQSKASKAATP